jgi:CrcB protein
MSTHALIRLFTALNQASDGSLLEPALREPLLVALGAIPGALSRYYLTVQATQWFGTTFPYGTLIINLTGAGFIGFLATVIEQLRFSLDWQYLLIIGFLGSYTTFSTYALDTANLLRIGSRKRALLYWAGSPILGFICVEIGILLARKLL